MKKLIALLIVTVGLLSCGTFETKGHKQARLETFAWLEMCQLLIDETDYECMRLLPPVVVYEPMRDGLHGYYNGTETIYINDKLKGDEQQDVLMHEAVHYVHVQHQFIPIPGPAELVCWSENEAWTLSGIYWGVDNSKWWQSYPHCWQWYGGSQYLRDIGFIFNGIEDIIDGIIFED